jgi:uncharacterized membrane protein
LRPDCAGVKVIQENQHFRKESNMAVNDRSIEQSIEVDVPVSTAYNQWTQFEDFPRFMEGVRKVKQLDDKRLHWRAEIGGKEVEWDAEITQQEPDQRIAWRSTSGRSNAGSLTFQPLGMNRCRITLRMDYDPKGFAENVGDAIGIVSARVQGDLRRFKQFIESRGTETGAWRGKIRAGEVVKSGRSGSGGYISTGMAGEPTAAGTRRRSTTPRSSARRTTGRTRKAGKGIAKKPM